MAIPISNVTRRVVYAASGTGPYAFTFEILANTDIAVYRDDTLLTLTTNYTVTINSNGTGSITLTAAPTGATQIAIVGNRTIQRTTDFVTGGDFFANTVNDEMDQQTIFAQQNAEGLTRALQAPQTDPTSIDMTLPRASVRANKTLAFDANGDPTTGEVIGDNRGNWAASVAYNKRDIVKDTSNGNIYYANTSHTSSGAQPISTNTDSAKWDLIVDNASAGSSATAAAASASAASTSASNASTSASNASTSATNAASSASTASTQATNASNSATAAASSASAASSSATAASGSATTASTQASNASTSASNASTSASGASTSATNAAASASTATTQASNASTSATNAASSASAASTSASNAATSATNASNSATTASTQASNASTSASNASTSATNAASSAAAAASALDSFDDRYLGSKSSDPTLDNDGNALLTGALYYNTTTQTMKVYDGANWITATAAGTTALLVYKYVATAGQTTFSGAASVGGTLSYTSNNIIVFVNGVSLDSTDYTATSGTSVVLASGASLNDEVVIVAFKSFTVADTYTKGEVDAFAVKLTGAQTVAGVKTFSSAPVLPAASIPQAALAANVAGNGPAFSAYATSGTVVANSTFVKITFDTENFDTNSNYASSRFTPTVAGYYQVTACVLTTNSAIGCSGLVFYKNGAAFAYGSQSQNTTGTTNVGGSALIYCNGSTDYIEVYLVQTTGSSITTVVGASHYNVFSGSLVRAA
jgi:hypothetical protein